MCTYKRSRVHVRRGFADCIICVRDAFKIFLRESSAAGDGRRASVRAQKTGALAPLPTARGSRIRSHMKGHHLNISQHVDFRDPPQRSSWDQLKVRFFALFAGDWAWWKLPPPEAQPSGRRAPSLLSAFRGPLFVPQQAAGN